MPDNDQTPGYIEGQEQHARGENNTNPHDSSTVKGYDRNQGYNDAAEAAEASE